MSSRLYFVPASVGFAVGLLMAHSMFANAPGGGNTGSAVTVMEVGKNVVMANGIINATISPVLSQITSLRYKGQEMVSQTGRHKSIYFFMDGDKGYELTTPCVLSVKQRTSEMVDISCKRIFSMQNSKMHPWDIDTHFVLRRGASGLYIYSVVDHPADYPDLNIGQYLMIWPMPQSGKDWLMEKIYVDEARHWEFPTPYDFDNAQATGIKEIVKLTTGHWKGKYDCKYMYNAEYWDLGCWGFASDRNRIGAWVVFGSHEFFNDGPTMSDLTAAAGWLHVMFNMNHYNGSVYKIPHGTSWRRVYGPYLLYCNSTSDGTGDDCWADARRQAEAEKAAWPYSWLTGNHDYPLKSERGTVTGRFIIKDTLKPNVTSGGAWVGLAQPRAGGNWQLDIEDYQFWIRAGSDGRFSIPNVRPGTYTLFAFATGAVGEFSKGEVEVKPSQETVLDDLTWNVPHPGATIAWEIGVPDRSPKEFRHGNDYFQPYLWDKFSGEWSNPLDYTVGTSDFSKDWNYVHCGYPEGEKWSPWKWRIHFKLPGVPPKGTATLTIAYASSYYGRTEIYVNDESKLIETVRPSIDGGNALIREGIHAKYCVQDVKIPVGLLKTGANTFTLVQGGNRYDRPFYHVMYDYLRLELPTTN
jgi:rhamnogalacturonan endolyase